MSQISFDTCLLLRVLYAGVDHILPNGDAAVRTLARLHRHHQLQVDTPAGRHASSWMRPMDADSAASEPLCKDGSLRSRGCWPDDERAVSVPR